MQGLVIGGLAVLTLALMSRSGSEPLPRKRVWPVSKNRGVISPFGAHRTRANGDERLHAGVDLGALVGDQILALDNGTVLHPVTGYSLGAGLQAVAIKHSDAEYIYAEILVDVKPGEKVTAGQVIGRVAKNSDGNSMLHLEAWEKAPHGFTEWTPTYRPPGLLNAQERLPKP